MKYVFYVLGILILTLGISLTTFSLNHSSDHDDHGHGNLSDLDKYSCHC